MEHQVNFWMMLWVTLAVVTGICFVAYFRDTFERVLAQAFTVFYRPLQQIQLQTARFLRSLYQWLRDQMALENETDSRHVIYRVMGALIFALLFLLFLYCDIGVTILTLANSGSGKLKWICPLIRYGPLPVPSSSPRSCGESSSSI